MKEEYYRDGELILYWKYNYDAKGNMIREDYWNIFYDGFNKVTILDRIRSTVLRN